MRSLSLFVVSFLASKKTLLPLFTLGFVVIEVKYEKIWCDEFILEIDRMLGDDWKLK